MHTATLIVDLHVRDVWSSCWTNRRCRYHVIVALRRRLQSHYIPSIAVVVLRLSGHTR